MVSVAKEAMNRNSKVGTERMGRVAEMFELELEEEKEEEEEYSLKKKMKFGQDALEGGEDGDEGVWQGDWNGDVRLVK